MKIEYIRNVQCTYMRIAMKEPLNKTEEEMLFYNAIEGILPVRWQQENDSYLLRYDITGKQALDTLLENTMADEKILKHLLSGILVAMKQLEKHLLSPEGLLLLPETIFWDYRTETMHFCYYPETSEDIRERLKRLMEYMLAKTDHKNQIAVRQVYGIYEELLKPAFCLSEIQKCLHSRCEQQDVSENEIFIQREDKALQSEEELYRRTEPEKRNVVWREVMKRIREKIMAWIKETLQRERRAKKEETARVYTVERSDEIREQPTTILDNREEEVEGILKYVGNNFLPDIVVSKVPFTIGSARNCDGVVEHPNISRYHARITCCDGEYFIEDLNSTNGTKINEVLLSYRTKTSLRKNERVCLANEPYRFI